VAGWDRGGLQLIKCHVLIRNWRDGNQMFGKLYCAHKSISSLSLSLLYSFKVRVLTVPHRCMFARMLIPLPYIRLSHQSQN
jgi:hypothetical protein